FVALVPWGTPTPATPGGQVFGCGNMGVAASFADQGQANGQVAQQALAQEIGHAFNRKHVLGCSIPQDIDSQYPSYPSLPFGSIGEHGFDVAVNRVQDPTTTRDVMTYCQPNVWVSPYTYLALMQALEEQWEGAGVQGGSSAEEALGEGEFLILDFKLH